MAGPQLHVASLADVPIQRDFPTKKPFLLMIGLCFPGCQLPWPLRDAFGRQETQQDMVTGPAPARGQETWRPLGTEWHAL